MYKRFGLGLICSLCIAAIALLPRGVSASAGTWSLTPAMQTVSGINSAIRLQDGRVLVIGAGRCCSRTISEVYDPNSRTWTRQGDLNRIRGAQIMVLLLDGRVLVAGGEQSTPRITSELFD